MKQKIKFLSATLLLFIFGLTISQAQSWNSTECEQLANYIHTNGVQTKLGNSTITLPNGTLSVIDKEVIGIQTDGINFWFFYKEKPNFKGNLIDGIFMFRLPTVDQDMNIKKAKEFITKTLKEKPKSLPKLSDAQDELTRSFNKIINFIKTNKKNNTISDYECDIDGITLKINCYFTIDLTLYDSNGNWHFFELNRDRPAEYGTYRKGLNGKKVKITQKHCNLILNHIN